MKVVLVFGIVLVTQLLLSTVDAAPAHGGQGQRSRGQKHGGSKQGGRGGPEEGHHACRCPPHPPRPRCNNGTTSAPATTETPLSSACPPCPTVAVPDSVSLMFVFLFIRTLFKQYSCKQSSLIAV